MGWTRSFPTFTELQHKNFLSILETVNCKLYQFVFPLLVPTYTVIAHFWTSRHTLILRLPGLCGFSRRIPVVGRITALPLVVPAYRRCLSLKQLCNTNQNLIPILGLLRHFFGSFSYLLQYPTTFLLSWLCPDHRAR